MAAARWPAPCRRLGVVLPAPITGCGADLKRQPARLGLAPSGRAAHVQRAPARRQEGRRAGLPGAARVCGGPHADREQETAPRGVFTVLVLEQHEPRHVQTEANPPGARPCVSQQGGPAGARAGQERPAPPPPPGPRPRRPEGEGRQEVDASPRG